MLRKMILYIAFCLLPALAVSQGYYVLAFNRLTDYATSDEAKAEISQELTTSLLQDLKENPDFADSLGVRQLKVLHSSDGLLVLYTWYYCLSDGLSQYGGLLRHGDALWPLTFNDKPVRAFEKYTPDNWCGGIYYDLIELVNNGETAYTLLAWDGNNGVTSKKIIDVLSFDKKGRAIFGKSVFEDARHGAQRVIMEYSAKQSLLLEYHAETHAIVTNALVPSDDKFSGVNDFYSAGDDFNVYRLEKGRWVLYSNVDLRMNKTDSKELERRHSIPSKGL